MPRKASPLSSSSIGKLYLELYFYSPHDMCFAWSVLYDISLCFLVYHNHPCCTHLLGETHLIGIYQNTLCALVISFELDSLLYVLHLYFLEHGGGFILKTFLISHASLILFESLLEHHGICDGYKFGPRMMGIQVGYNKNYHRK